MDAVTSNTPTHEREGGGWSFTYHSKAASPPQPPEKKETANTTAEP